MKPILFSGVQPTGKIHIGNYLGALKQWVELQNSKNFLPIFSIVDYHSITQDYNPKEKQKQILNTAIDFLSIGINPKKSIVFVQSQISEHTELAWILNCLTTMSDLFRMTQFKDKTKVDIDGIIEEVEKITKEVEKEIEKRTYKKIETHIVSSELNRTIEKFEKSIKKLSISLENIRKSGVGLFDYPVLMAADILLYKTSIVPVGEDQVQHVELARIIARKFNNRFGKYFNEPKAKLVSVENSARVMSLTYPEKKMSKSLGEKSYIALSDSAEIVEKKIKSAVTTEQGGKNLLNLFKQFSADEKLINKFQKELETGEIKYSELKPALANAINQELKPIQEKREYYLNNPKKVNRILNKGAKCAQKIAKNNLQEIKTKIGLL